MTKQETTSQAHVSTDDPKTTATITWSESVWFSDIDDTLIDTFSASLSASEGIKQALASHAGEAKAAEIQTNFNGLYQLMYDGYRVRHEADWEAVEGGKPAFEDLLNTITSLQTQVKNDYGHIKKWSREIFIKLAADKTGISLTPEQVHEAADAYWLTLAEHAEVLPDAKRLADEIARHNRPLFLATSSDARLKMQADGQFIYDPAYSEALKRERIELLRAKGLRFNTISIGDPEDKPHLDFFTKVIHLAQAQLGHTIDCSKAIMLGDSFGGDLETPKEQLNFGLVVLRKSHHANTSIDDAHKITTGDLYETVQFISG